MDHINAYYAYREKARRYQLKNAINYIEQKQHPTKEQLYGYLHPISKIIQVRRTRHAEYCRKSKGELMLSYEPFYTDVQELAD